MGVHTCSHFIVQKHEVCDQHSMPFKSLQAGQNKTLTPRREAENGLRTATIATA